MSLVLFATNVAATCDPDWFYTLYATGMRNSLFTGFLTLCGFLMSAKTFIVVNMKKEVYDRKLYQENFRVQQKLKPGVTLYGPLQSLATLLTANVALSLLTAASQFTIGLIPSVWAAAWCVGVAAVTLIFLGVSLALIRRNLKMMFHWLEVELRAADKPPVTSS
ncbi:MAG TPA: hypothetical protein VGE74_18415 [Gemmata sp.]